MSDWDIRSRQCWTVLLTKYFINRTSISSAVNISLKTGCVSNKMLSLVNLRCINDLLVCLFWCVRYSAVTFFKGSTSSLQLQNMKKMPNLLFLLVFIYVSGPCWPDLPHLVGSVTEGFSCFSCRIRAGLILVSSQEPTQASRCTCASWHWSWHPTQSLIISNKYCADCS